MKAMIFAAGLGTRLRPITLSKPKALVEVNGITLLERLINKLKAHKITDIIINIHYLADQIISFLKANNDFGIRITLSDERDRLLDTGGGLKKAGWFFNKDEPFILYNVDILSDIDLTAMRRFHDSSRPLVTLAIDKASHARRFLFNDDNLLCGWENTDTKENIISRPHKSPLTARSFCGVHIISPAILDLITETDVFSIVKLYLRLAANHKLMGYQAEHSFCFDVGDEESLNSVNNFFLKREA